jgi:hypothetical protein
MRNPCGKKFFREHWICLRKGGRDRRADEKCRLKPARAKVEPALWSPKESPSLPGQDFNQNWGQAIPFVALIFRFPVGIIFPSRRDLAKDSKKGLLGWYSK